MTQTSPPAVIRPQPDAGMLRGSSAPEPRRERSQLTVWTVLALQAVLLIELVVRVANETAASTEGYVGLSVMFGAIVSVLIVIATAAWWVGRSWPILLVDLGWAFLLLIRIWPPLADIAEGVDPFAITPLLAALVAAAAAWLVLSGTGRARWVTLAGFLALVGILDFVQEGRLVLLGVGLLAFGVAGLLLSGRGTRVREPRRA